MLPAAICCIRLYDPVKRVLKHVTGKSLPREYVALMDNYPAEIRFGSCAAAIALQRQIIVPDISKDALWEHRRDAAAESRPARLLVDADHRRRRAHARHLRDLPEAHRHAVAPRPRAGRPHGTARAHRDRAAPLGRRAARERGPLPRAVRQRRRGRLPGDAGRLPAVRESGADRHARLRLARGAARDRLDRRALRRPGPAPRADREAEARRQAGRGRVRAEAPRRQRSSRSPRTRGSTATSAASRSGSRARSPTSPSASAPSSSSTRRRSGPRSRCSPSRTP